MSDGTCSHDACEEPVNARDLCTKHYLRDLEVRRSRGEVPALQGHNLSAIDAVALTATCFVCGPGIAIKREYRPGAQARVEGVNFVCAKRTPKNERVNAEPGALSPTSRARQINSRFQIREDVYERLLLQQDGLCAICRRPPEPDRMLAVDHDTRCCPPASRRTCGNCIRGLLCTNCNWGLGHLGDDPEVLLRAVSYVQVRRSSLMPDDIIAEPGTVFTEAAA